MAGLDLSSGFRSAYDLSFQVSPIILNGGIVANTLGGMMPIIGLVGQLGALAQSILSSGSVSLDNFFARFVVLPGGTIINNAVGTYPFANQQVAGNAIVMQPKNVSLLMIAPVKDTGGYLTKLAIFTSLQSSLEAHCAAGGTFHVATPARIYTNCILTSMTDVTSGEGKQQQIQWQLDFVQPLLTQQAASSAFGALMSKLAGGQQVTSPAWSGAVAAAGSAVQGALEGVGNMAGVVNQFLSQPVL
ncbi:MULTISPECIES: hypothetical protein [Burkholderia]|uniref:hypothetical protein n=1 Tax=Burkholderia TaxID=32008 RepID=UPI0007545BF5|nr:MULTISPECIES: hypothetical protein [Burkholderia]AOJ69335.1 hypothetical protein WS78_11650 [Burkholderia savannae]KVG37453.1 hypothetical protein WS77_01880 [Burkholderia sp. MSMB0265]KVG88283.1 hypothetical protein WS81_25345 [Burkholderia sp. MSMB2040]KVG93834.1 hypothetical protein WS82_08840 [Burkholderia sp. MSMB2041]KVH01086.1 hypothetical protein WS83_20400 [Burkholderia sp. MSMB2042]